MSLQKLLANIQEYHNLLGFLYKKHPQVLKEYKIRGAGLAAQTPTPTDVVITPVTNRNDYTDTIQS